MIPLILFLALGAAFLVVLSFYFFAHRPESAPSGTADALVGAREALHCLQTALLPPELTGRIFAGADLSFVRSTCSPRIQQKFLEERRMIALSWVAQLRKQVLRLKRFHVEHAREFAEIDARSEFALAADFAILLMACRILQCSFYVWGPFASKRIVRVATGIAATVCGVSERSLGFLKPISSTYADPSSAGTSAIV
jgi:hypothetical protein